MIRLNAGEIDRAVGSNAGDHGNNHPGDRIVEDGGRQYQLAKVAAQRPNLHQNHGHDLDRRDGEGRTEKQRRHQLSTGRGNEPGRQRVGQGHTARKGHGNSKQ
jgi:hypothetical protein